MIPDKEREALMRLTMCAREECGMCKYKDTCDFDFQFETATKCMNILADALRNSSEKPNNCETCKYNDYLWYTTLCDACCRGNSHYEPKTEPIKRTLTGTHGERIEYTEAEMVVRGEPQTEREGE